MKRVIIPIENYELDDYKTHKDGMKDYAYLILLISRKLISFPYLSEENINTLIPQHYNLTLFISS